MNGKKNFELATEFGNKENVFASFKVKKSNPNEKITIVRKTKRAILVEVKTKGVSHYELYWFIQRPTMEDSRDAMLREGHNIIIKGFSFGDPGIAEVTLDFVCDELSIDPWKYYKLEFDYDQFVKDHPIFSKRDIKYFF